MVLCQEHEFFDGVLSRCSDCKEVCHADMPSTRRIYCARNCPDYYRQHFSSSLEHNSTMISQSHSSTFTNSRIQFPYPGPEFNTPPSPAGLERLIDKPLFWTSVSCLFISFVSIIAIIVLCVRKRREIARLVRRYRLGIGRRGRAAARHSAGEDGDDVSKDKYKSDPEIRATVHNKSQKLDHVKIRNPSDKVCLLTTPKGSPVISSPIERRGALSGAEPCASPVSMPSNQSAQAHKRNVEGLIDKTLVPKQIQVSMVKPLQIKSKENSIFGKDEVRSGVCGQDSKDRTVSLVKVDTTMDCERAKLQLLQIIDCADDRLCLQLDKGNIQPTKDNRQPDRDNRQLERDNRQTDRGNSQSEKDNRQPERDNRQQARDNRQQHKDKPQPFRDKEEDEQVNKATYLTTNLVEPSRLRMSSQETQAMKMRTVDDLQDQGVELCGVNSMLGSSSLWGHSLS